MNFDRAVILHGKPPKEKAQQPGFDPSRSNWLGWLADELNLEGVQVISPRLSEPENPDFEQYLAKLESLGGFIRGARPKVAHRTGDSRCIVVAHSAAVGPTLEWFAKTGPANASVLAVAPWIDPNGRYPGMRLPVFYSEHASQIMRDATIERMGEVTKIVTSDNDDKEAKSSLGWLRERIPVLPEVVIEGAGHFVTGNSLAGNYSLRDGLMGSTCPEILRVIEELE